MMAVLPSARKQGKEDRGEKENRTLSKPSRVILVRPGGVETRYPAIEEATAAGEAFLLEHPSECGVTLYEVDENGREGRTRKIFHWRDEFFHYLDMPGGGHGVGRIFKRPCRRTAGAKECREA